MTVKNLLDKPKKLLLFIFLLYAIVPYETVSNPLLSYVFHLIFIVFVGIFALYTGNFKIKMNQFAKFTMFFLICFIAINSVVSYGLNEFLLFLSIVFGSIVASTIYNNRNFYNLFVSAFKWLIVFSISMLFLQLIVLDTTGKVLHIHEMFFPFSEARIGVFGLLNRLGGVYLEPGTYSNWMHLFLVIYMVLSENINRPIFYIGAISMILTLSAYGVIIGIYLLMVLLLSKIKHSSLKKKFSTLLLLMIVSFFSIGYIGDSTAVKLVSAKMDSSSDGSANLRKQAYERYIENIEDYFIVGEGFSNKFGEGIASIQDAGLLLNMSVALGILFSIIFIMIYTYAFLKKNNMEILFASLPIFISKIYYYEFSFWLLFFLLILKNKQFLTYKKY